MKLTIISRKHQKEFFFIRPGASYILVEIDNKHNKQTTSHWPRRQICHGGGFRGETVSYDGDDQEAFNKVCRAWYRSWKRNRDDEVNDHLLPLRRRR